MNGPLTHIDLFSGIGGFAISAEWAGFRTIAMCEIDPFCQEVLKARFGAVAYADNGRQSSDIREAVSGGQGAPITDTESGGGNRGGDSLYRPTLIPDIRDFDGTRFRGATLLTGGFPCQPFSHAGKRRGTDDDRHLWPQMLRVIGEARPTWIIGENVSGIRSLEIGQGDADLESDTADEPGGEDEYTIVLDGVCNDLEGIGYEVQPIVIPACAVNAPHRRDRVWICARRIDKDAVHDRGGVGEQEKQGRIGNERDAVAGDAERVYQQSVATDAQDTVIGGNGGRGDGDTPRLRRTLQTPRPDSDAPLSTSWEPRLAAQHEGREDTRRGSGEGPGWDVPWIEVATCFCRVDDGLPAWVHSRRVARLKALGNAIVPAVAYEIIRNISVIEKKR